MLDIRHDESGQRRQQTKGGFRTRKECEAALTDILQRLQTGNFVESTRLTLAAFLDQFLDSTRATVRPSTLAGYALLADVYIKPAIGSTPLQKLTPGQLNGLYADLLESGRRDGKGGLSARTVRYVHVTLHRALGEALKWGLVTRNVAEAATPPKQGAAAPLRVWSAVELRAFLQYIESDFYHAPLLLAATSGMRRGEVLGLRWCDLDLAAGRIAVRQTLVALKGEIMFSTPKTAKGRRNVALDGKTVAVLKAHRRQVLEDRLILGKGAPDAEGLVFTAPDGSPINPESFSDHFTRLVKAAGLPLIRFHDLRHSHATLALSAGVHPKVVSERLGHSTVAFTLDVYSHSIPALQEDAAAKVAALVFASER
jgi:integrase